VKLEEHVKEELRYRKFCSFSKNFRIRSDMESFVHKLQSDVESLSKKIKKMDENNESSPLWAHREKLRSTGVDLTK
jgi:hypothetical protein